MKVYDEARTGATLRARRLRRDSTDAERVMWRALREALLDRKWRRQMPVGPYFVDFACFADKLIVELDGGQHADAAQYDTRRSEFLDAQGYRVIRFWNNDVLKNTDAVVEQIANALPASPFRRCAPPSLSQRERDERPTLPGRERVRP